MIRPPRSTRFRQPAPPRTLNAEDGVLLVDKPAGPTSHDVVARIRSRFAFRKVGHGGTLDPQATGLLLVLVGKGTKLSPRLMGSDKTYEGVIHLGVTTDTQDADGEVLREAPAEHVTREELEAQLAAHRGDLMQTPPMVSAKKVNGVPLYKHARKGRTVEREPKMVHVYDFRLLDFRPPRASFLVRCSKGTYVRTLCDDIGAALGCGAHLAALRRTACADFSVSDALPLDRLLDMEREALLQRILPLSRFAP